MIDDKTLVEEIKTRLLITGNYHDSLILAYARDVKEYLHSAGIPAAVVNSGVSVGIISKGVSDLWNRGLEDGILSGFFRERVIQMKYTKWGVIDNEGEPPVIVPMTKEDIDECTDCLNQSENEYFTYMSAMSEEDK